MHNNNIINQLQIMAKQKHGHNIISGENLLLLQQTTKMSLKELEILCLELNFLPERYLRNLTTLSLENQLTLRKSKVLLIGLGGLGGHCLDMLLRLGVGELTAVDGDIFEASNLNRQLLATEHTLKQSKSSAALAHAQNINNAVDFYVVNEFIDQKDMCELMFEAKPHFNIVIDALGGLKQRMQLQNAATQANLSLVTAAIAGWSGYISSVPAKNTLSQNDLSPDNINPAQLLGTEANIEDELGTPAPTVAFAASIMIKLALEALLNKAEPKTLLFDLASCTLENVRL